MPGAHLCMPMLTRMPLMRKGAHGAVLHTQSGSSFAQLARGQSPGMGLVDAEVTQDPLQLFPAN